MMSPVRASVALLAALAVVAAGCGGGGSKQPSGSAARTQLVPWTSEQVPALATRDASPAPPCRASQLRPRGKGFVFQAAVAGATGTVGLRNVGKSACRLTGRPRVRFVGAPRQPRQQQLPLPPQQPPFPQLLRPASWILSLAPGRSAALGIQWRNWCVPNARAAKKPLVAPKAVRVALGGGRGSLDVPYNAVTTCEHPGEPSTIHVQPFQPPTLPSGKPWTTQVLSAKALTLAGEPGPLRARRGQLFRYSIALRNDGRETVRFDTCPFAVELLAPAGKAEAHALNCTAAHPLAPHGSLRFEMRIHIPPNAPLGPNGLFWELDPLGARGPEVVTRLVVDR